MLDLHPQTHSMCADVYGGMVVEVKRRERKEIRPGHNRDSQGECTTQYQLFFHPSCSCSTLPIVPPPSLFLLPLCLNTVSASLLPSAPSHLPLFLQSTFLTPSREWLTPWSRCAALSWGPWAGTLSVNVNSSYRKSPLSWGPIPDSMEEVSKWPRGHQDQLYIWGQGQDFQDRVSPGPGRPMVMSPHWWRMDRVQCLDLQQERDRTKPKARVSQCGFCMCVET